MKKKVASKKSFRKIVTVITQIFPRFDIWSLFLTAHDDFSSIIEISAVFEKTNVVSIFFPGSLIETKSNLKEYFNSVGVFRCNVYIETTSFLWPSINDFLNLLLGFTTLLARNRETKVVSLSAKQKNGPAGRKSGFNFFHLAFHEYHLGFQDFLATIVVNTTNKVQKNHWNPGRKIWK